MNILELDFTKLSTGNLQWLIRQAEQELGERMIAGHSDYVRLRAKTGSRRYSVKTSYRGHISIEGQPLYQSKMVKAEGKPEWNDTRSNSQRHGGLSATQVYQVPNDALLRIEFAEYNKNLPCDSISVEILASEITERIEAHGYFIEPVE